MNLLDELNDLTRHHLDNCPDYEHYVSSLFSTEPARRLEDLPYLPVRVFKNNLVKSVSDQQVFRYLTSSGTGVGGKSLIAVDRDTARLQSRALVSNVQEILGEVRGPFLVLASDEPTNQFSAQTAAINGFGMFATEKCYALDREGKVRWDQVKEFLARNAGAKILVLGFTFQVWLFLDQIESSRAGIDMSSALLLHGGGWKKLERRAVSKDAFNSRITKVTGCSEVRNYYGMIEQTGSIYLECSEGSLHAPLEGGFLIRNPVTLEIASPGVEGLVQVFSGIQKSYPGHSLLTEDLGYLEGVGSCRCGRKSKRLIVTGRLSRAEVRGCSDAVA